MILTEKQQKGLEIALERYRNKQRYTVISGYAGVGKSTLVRAIIDAIDLPEEDICYATYTGKAAQVLQQMGNRNAMTLHKLLYESKPLGDGTFVHIPKASLDYRLVIVDEVSMAPKDMMKLLFQHRNVYIICLGDPFQLPPINENENNHILDNPHIFLDEIMRQAAESEIIQVSMDIREGKKLTPFDGKEVKIIDKQDFSVNMLKWADQIIVGTNQMRHRINNEMRMRMGRGNAPENGDKVICLRNYWEQHGSDGMPLINGSIGYLKNPYRSWSRIPPWVNNGKSESIEIICSDIVTESNEEYRGLTMDKKQILTGVKSISDPKVAYKISANRKIAHLLPLEFEYGYAITCHKAQGSQWNKILIFEERFPFDKEEHARWLYTAVTRAIDKVIIVKA